MGSSAWNLLSPNRLLKFSVIGLSFLQLVFQDLVDGLEVARDEAALVSIADKAAKHLGFRWFAYLASAESQTTIISSYPAAWVRHYRDQNFDRVDPIVRPRQWPARSFFWNGKDRWPTALQRQLFAEAASFQIRSGVTVPIRGAGNSFAAFTLATDDYREEFGRWAAEAIDTLQLIGLYYHAGVDTKLRLGLRRLGDAPLTPRETQCLTWAARGKTMAETAQILGITKRTVEFHLDNTRTKLKAVTLSQAVAEATRRNLLPRS